MEKNNFLKPAFGWRDVTEDRSKVAFLAPGQKRFFSLAALSKIGKPNIAISGSMMVPPRIKIDAEAIVSFELTDKGVGRTVIYPYKRQGRQLVFGTGLVADSPHVKAFNMIAQDREAGSEKIAFDSLPEGLRGMYQAIFDQTPLGQFKGQSISEEPAKVGDIVSRYKNMSSLSNWLDASLKNAFLNLINNDVATQIGRHTPMAVHEKLDRTAHYVHGPEPGSGRLN